MPHSLRNTTNPMGRFNGCLLAFLVAFALVRLVHGQDQQGFISIDCGSNSSYEEPTTGISYVSDLSFIDTGVMDSIPPFARTGFEQQLWTLRSFPQGKRNCYNIKVQRGTKYLIRASFLYGNYDSQNHIPQFDLYFGPNFWTTVQFEGVDIPLHEEIVHITTSKNVQICLVKSKNGIPFISALELRPLPNTTYVTTIGSLANYERLDFGTSNKAILRYPYDVYDRTWKPLPLFNGWTTISTSYSVDNQDSNGFTVPSVVLSTASTMMNASEPMEFFWKGTNRSDQFYIYMYFAELEKLQANETRKFKIYLNDEILLDEDVIVVYLRQNVVRSISPLAISGNKYNFKLIMNEGSTLPPILNALEIFEVINFTQAITEQEDVDAIESIKKGYGITKDWQGDPCAPQTFVWEGLNCSYNGSDPPRITSLNLTSSGLTGQIAANISNLEKLEILDLSRNHLDGPVPDFLARMPLLRVLNLSGNNLSGEIPDALIDKGNKGLLLLSLEGNPNLYETAPSEKKKNNITIPIVAAVGGVLIILILILSSIYFIRRKRNPKGPVIVKPHPQDSHDDLHPFEPLKSSSRQYSYSDVLKITNNFDTLLGEGGFGKVYYGRMGNTEVAIKMLSLKSGQGYREFQAEVDLLLRVHHRNLTSLVGYCNESETKMGLIYEYMKKGNLGSVLSGEHKDILELVDRLKIALDAAQGLEYLHSGCTPPIIHRDIKSSNILLNEQLQAKLADFGLSRAFPTEGGATHVTTKIVGTPAYLDPEYYTSFKLTEKSDVYCYGIVLLELISGRPVLVESDERSHIIKWADWNINQGDVYSIIDPKIKEGCNVNCVWKALDIAMACTVYDSTNRPTMTRVVSELKECLSLQVNQREGLQADSTTSITLELNYQYSPMAR